MNKLIKTSVATLSYLATARFAFAAAITNPVNTDFTNIGSIFNTIFLFLIGVVGGLAIIFIVIGGIRYILAGGDPKATDSARHQITAALIGLVVALLAVAIVVIVGNILGSKIDLTNPSTTPAVVR